MLASVVVWVEMADLANELAAMRQWFDQNKCTPAKFQTRRHNRVVGVHVEFMSNADAERFKEAFYWKKQRPEFPLLSHSRQWALSFNGSTNAESEGNAIYLVCWYRLMAEEVRTEAEGFRSTSARTTMQIAAEAWDRLAEDLERRISTEIPNSSMPAPIPRLLGGS